MADLVVFGIVLTIFVAWIAAELWWPKWLGIVLGTANMILLAVLLYGAQFNIEMYKAMQNITLRQLQTHLAEEQPGQVKRALDEYFDTYERTDSHKAALFRMHYVLSGRIDAGDANVAPTSESGSGKVRESAGSDEHHQAQ